MRILIVALLSLLLLPVATRAAPACGGTDLGALLSPRERAEIRTLTEQTPYPRGNHWTARRDGQTLHLIGTLHADDPRMEPTANRLAPVLARTDLLLLEVAQSRTAASTTRQTYGFLPSDAPSLLELMGEDRWADFTAVLRLHDLAPAKAARMQPWLLNQILSTPPCMLRPSAAEAGLDHRLEALANARHIPVGSLETADQAVAAVLPTQPLEQQVRDLQTSLPLYSQSANFFATLREGYFAEDRAFMLELLRRRSRDQSSLSDAAWDQQWQAFQTSMLDHRNTAWMRRILARDEADIVIAVGAAHLGGRTGLLNQLAQAGFELTRAPF